MGHQPCGGSLSASSRTYYAWEISHHRFSASSSHAWAPYSDNHDARTDGQEDTVRIQGT